MSGVCKKCFNVIDVFMQMCPLSGLCEVTPAPQTEGFEAWWINIYKGKLGPITMELSFREVAEKAWNAARANSNPNGSTAQ